MTFAPTPCPTPFRVEDIRNACEFCRGDCDFKVAVAMIVTCLLTVTICLWLGRKKWEEEDDLFDSVNKVCAPFYKKIKLRRDKEAKKFMKKLRKGVGE